MRLTTKVIFTLSTLIICAPSYAQIYTFTHDQMIKYTAKNPFERFEGDNLATAIFAATRNGGMVIDGAIRDLEGIFPIDMAAYFRGVHPTPIDRGRVMLTAYNTPVRIGNATVMPGDIVFGDREGVYFIRPAQLKTVHEDADVTHIHDEWTKKKLLTGKYKSSEIYPSPSSPELKKEYEEYLKEHLKK